MSGEEKKKIEMRMSFRGDLAKRLNEIKKYYHFDSYTDIIRFLITGEHKRLTTRPRFEHLNTLGNHAKIVDNGMNRIASVYFNPSSWCDVCDKDDCVHVEFAWTIPNVAEILHKYGFKSPEDKAMERVMKRGMKAQD